jgi:hypothetical protein
MIWLFGAAYAIVGILAFVLFIYMENVKYAPAWDTIDPSDEDILACALFALAWPLTLILLGVLNFGRWISKIIVRLRKKK